MNILVTGHRGYIGRVLLPLLHKENYAIRGYDSFYYNKSNENIPNIEELNKDIRNIEYEDVKGIDVVIHLAALSNDPLGYYRPSVTYDINNKAAVKIAKIAKRAGVSRFIFTSSCSVYGAKDLEFVTEESRPNPITPYGESKIIAENEISKLANEEFSPTFLRPGTAYGYSPMLRSDLVLNNLVGWAHLTGKIYLKSDGKAWRPLVHIEDISKAIIAVIKSEKEVVNNQIFNVGLTEENYRVIDLAEIVEKVVPKSNIVFAENAGSDKRNYRVNCDKIQDIIPKFKPTWNCKKGAKELYINIKRNFYDIETFEGGPYNRISHIKKLIKDGFMDNNLYWGKI
jgi:nucleoside-diphosphate-sugar epimerase